jgi:hypothetical protein
MPNKNKGSDSDEIRREQIKLELNVLLEEYKALRSEILMTLTADYGMTALTLTAIGALLAASSLALQAYKPVLFGIAPLLFSCLAWIQLRYALTNFHLSNHLIQAVRPAVQRCLQSYASLDSRPAEQQSSFNYVLNWETRGRSVLRPQSLLMKPTYTARFVTPVFAACASSFTYAYLTYGNANGDISDLSLFVLDLSFVFYTVWAGWRVEKQISNEPLVAELQRLER